MAQGVPFAREYGGLLDNRSLRWRPGQPHLLRPGPDRPAAPARRLPGPGPRRSASATWSCINRTEMLDVVVVDGRAAGIVVRDLLDRRGQLALGPRRRAGHRRLLQRLLPVDQRHGLQHHGDLAGPPPGRLLRQPLLHPDPPDVHPGERRVPVEAHADVGVAPQRRPHLGAEGPRRHALARPDPRGPSATTSSSASTRPSATSCRATSPAATPRR